MGAPKQKWTPEEEAALKAGVLRHGQGKWRTILKDPEFSGVLYLRSNVDLKVKLLFHCFSAYYIFPVYDDRWASSLTVLVINSLIRIYFCLT